MKNFSYVRGRNICWQLSLTHLASPNLSIIIVMKQYNLRYILWNSPHVENMCKLLSLQELHTYLLSPCKRMKYYRVGILYCMFLCNVNMCLSKNYDYNLRKQNFLGMTCVRYYAVTHQVFFIFKANGHVFENFDQTDIMTRF